MVKKMKRKNHEKVEKFWKNELAKRAFELYFQNILDNIIRKHCKFSCIKEIFYSTKYKIP